MLHLKPAAGASNGDFGTGSVSGNIMRLGLPMMAAEFVNVLYNLVDRMYIGHLENTGTASLTGIGICFPLITLIGAFANLFSTSGAPLSSIARGEGNNRKGETILCTAFTMLLIVGLVLTVSLYWAAPFLLELLGGTEETLPYALSYFRIYVLGTVPVLISLGMNAFINAQGFARVGMLTVIIGAVINIVLDPLMIFVLQMGAAGAALATVLSQLVSAVWVIGFLCGKKPILRLSRLCVDRESAKAILRLGVTGFTFKVTNSITQAIVNIVLKTWGGAQDMLYVGAMSLINSIREIMSLPTSGISGGGVPVISFNFGARKYKRVTDSVRFCLYGSLIINLVIWAIVEFFPQPLIRIFTPDTDLINLTVRCMRIYFGVFPFMALQMTGQNTFVALNYPKYALIFSLLRKVGLIVPFTLLLPGLGFGAEGVFWAELFSQLIGASACYITMYFRLYRRMKPLQDGAKMS